MMNEAQDNSSDKLRLDPARLSERDLEELARLIVRKLRILMKQESERSGSRSDSSEYHQ